MYNSLSHKVSKTITRHSLLRPQGRVIVTVSGGADSVALLSVLLELGYDCVAAHCNFHLRGAESNRDMRFVEQLTEQLGIDLYVKDFDVASRCCTTGESLEMACRELRYQWFFELLDRDCAQAIAVGHHREDQVETFFLNLMRGSGLAGLAGMRYRNEHVVRPLLDVSRQEIEAYLAEKGLRWIVDSTNASNEFARNRVRNQLLPVLENLFPGASESILKTMEILRENHDVYTAAVSQWGAKYYDRDSDEVGLAEMAANEKFARAILFEMLKSEGFNRSMTDSMLEAASRDGGTFTGRGSHTRDVDHGILRAPRALLQRESGEIPVNISRDIFEPMHIEITHHDIREFRPERNPAVAYIDERATAAGHKWAVRHWRRGDRMTPYGMNDSKLLSDIFSDAHLSAEAKRNVWLLTCDGEIVWAIGLRASSHFTLGPDTKRYIRLVASE